MDTVEPENKSAQSFLGVSFGLGFGASISSEDIVTEAQVAADNTIVAKKRARQTPRVILESHYYGWCTTRACNEGRRGFGPYFGIVAKSDNLISAISFGLMYGWRNTVAADSQGFSVGVGVLLDDSVTSLAKGFKVGQPLPPGEAAIRYEEKARWSGLFFCSRTF